MGGDPQSPVSGVPFTATGARGDVHTVSGIHAHPTGVLPASYHYQVADISILRLPAPSGRDMFAILRRIPVDADVRDPGEQAPFECPSTLSSRHDTVLSDETPDGFQPEPRGASRVLWLVGVPVVWTVDGLL